MELEEAHFRNTTIERREKVVATLARLRSLKSRVTELRLQLEALRELQLEKQEILSCDHCGRPIRKGTEITTRDHFGENKRSFHSGCFKEFLSS
jgi:hypothetical protein